MFGRNTGKLLKDPTMGAHTINYKNVHDCKVSATLSMDNVDLLEMFLLFLEIHQYD